MSQNSEIIGYLNDLIETCKDSEKGFREAAASVGKDGESRLRTLLNLHSQERAEFAAELQNEVLRRGGEPEESGHASATLQRRWLGLKLELKAGPDYADTGDYEVEVLTNCEAGEKVAMENYEAILKQTLPADLRSMLESQYSKIRQADERLRLLSMEYKQRESISS